MKARRPILLAAAALAVAALVAATLFASSRFPGSAGSAPGSPEQQASALIDKLASGSTASDPSSSNPYDYAIDNPTLDALVALGTPALKVAGERLSTSDEDGLTECLTAIAAERIARVDLRARSSFDPWETGKGWLVQWNAHLEAIPEGVATIG